VRRVLAEDRGFLLFGPPHLLHLRVGVASVEAVARAAGAVRDRHTREVFVRLAEALEDAEIGHDLEVVLVRRNSQMGGTRQGRVHGRAIRHKDLRRQLMELHRILRRFT
jgi:hypothetical protein